MNLLIHLWVMRIDMFEFIIGLIVGILVREVLSNLEYKGVYKGPPEAPPKPKVRPNSGYRPPTQKFCRHGLLIPRLNQCRNVKHLKPKGPPNRIYKETIFGLVELTEKDKDNGR